ncbi:MAG: TasA family protein [Actinomycetes bacterium]
MKNGNHERSALSMVARKVRPLYVAHGGSTLLQIGALIAAVVGGVSLVGSSVFASLDATAVNNSAQGINTHTLELSLANNGQGFNDILNKLIPGDVVNRYVTLNQAGSADGFGLTLHASDANTSDLTGPNNTSVRGLQVAADECVGGVWTPTTGVCTGGTVTSLFSYKPFNTIGTMANPGTGLSVSSLTSGTSLSLRISIKYEGSESSTNAVLPASTIQGQSALVTWTFREDQVTPTVPSNS